MRQSSPPRRLTNNSSGRTTHPNLSARLRSLSKPLLLCLGAILVTILCINFTSASSAMRARLASVSKSLPSQPLSLFAPFSTSPSSVPMTDKIAILFSTAPSKEVATKISDHLVENKLAACVQVLPGISSTYLWEGKINRDEEHLILIKTRSSLIDKIKESYTTLHPYKVPEILGIDADAKISLPAYLQWVLESTIDPSSSNTTSSSEQNVSTMKL